MVKLASARDFRAYGPRLSRRRWEYINAGLYVFGVVLLASGMASQLGSYSAWSGLVVVLIGLGFIAAANLHDLVAHMAGVDWRFSLVGYDSQLLLVEFAVPIVQLLGTALVFVAVLLVFIQGQKRYTKRKLEQQALASLIAGPVLWLLGSVHNTCQVYERADGHVQMLQKSVQLPLVMGSLLFLIAGVFNRIDYVNHDHGTYFKALGSKWAWLGFVGSLLFLVGGLLNVVKVFKMHQMDGMRLEKLRGGAQERLLREREGHMPLLAEEENRKLRHEAEARARQAAAAAAASGSGAPASTPYKDVLLGKSQV